ncbi:hypothetical protein H6G96_05935 [Nostoc sp. FACHB-892]|nr:hypothetical protein [Nostoc sp. FACHB-892]
MRSFEFITLAGMKKLSAVGSAIALVMMQWMWAMSTMGYSAITFLMMALMWRRYQSNINQTEK